MTFPINDLTPVSHGGPLPDAADVVVIGGGIIGVMTAWELAKRGVAVTLLEKGRIAGEQSSRNWGWIRAQGRDLAEMPIMLDAQAMWPEIAKSVDTDIGLQQTGTLYLTDKPSEIDRYEKWVHDTAGFQLSSRILTTKQIADLVPDAARSWTRALYTPTDYRAEPWVTVPAMARAAVAAGAQIIEDCAVRLLDITNGQITGVFTERGRIAAQRVVLAGGSWSSLFLRRHGVAIPQLSVRATVAATDPLPMVHDGGALSDKFSFRRRADGGYTLAPSGFQELFVGPDAFRALRAFVPQLIEDPFGTRLLPMSPKGYPDAWGTSRTWRADDVSPFEKQRILNPKPNAAKVAKLARDFQATFPSLGAVSIKTAWAGMIDSMPDMVPVVDQCDAIGGLTICTGMCGHGFGIGPAFGRINAKLAMGEQSGHDLTRFSLSRFLDGRALARGPDL